LNAGKDSTGKAFVDPEKRAVFEQPAFRRAVSCALDRDGMVRSVLLGLGTPQYGPISSGNKTWYDAALRPTTYDPQQSKTLLAQMGLKDTNGDGVLEFGARARPLEILLFTARGDAARERTAEIIKQNLAQVGIRINVQLLLPRELGPRIQQSFDYESILHGLSPSDIVPDLLTDLWYSNGLSHFWNPAQSKPGTPWEAQIDSLITQLVQNLDPALRLKAFLQVQEVWANQLPAISTFAPNILTGWRNTVGNTRPAVLPPYLLWNSEELTKRPR
jgi:peptide/nickel transport system substrate-binding protein